MERDDAGPREVEAAALIRSSDPATVREIEALSEVAGYVLVAQAERNIEDTYFDTPGRDLGTRRIALRIRIQDGVPLLTMKGGGGGGAVADRLEVEAPWSEQALDAIVKALAARGVAIPAPADPGARFDPRSTLESLGFEVIQSRPTRRSPRNVALPTDGLVLAELVIDHVRYRIGDRIVQLAELEVEAKGDGNEAVVAEIIGALEDAFPGRLQAWPHGKLATGESIASLVETGPPEDLIDRSGKISAAGYDALSEDLEQRDP